MPKLGATPRTETVERYAALPEARKVMESGPRPACTCGTCKHCVWNAYMRAYRKAGRLGRWSSNRARAAREMRAMGTSWEVLAQRFGYSSANAVRTSVLQVARSEEERRCLLAGVGSSNAKAALALAESSIRKPEAA